MTLSTQRSSCCFSAGIFAELLRLTELQQLLSRRGPFTVFAPTNAAFNKLPPGTLDTLRDPSASAVLQRILSYHISETRVASGDLSGGQSLPTLLAQHLSVQRAGALILVNDALLERADLTTDNGVVHVVDSVLLPSADVTTTAPAGSSSSSTSMAPSTAQAQRPVNLLFPANTDGSLSPAADGSVFFPGSLGLRVTGANGVDGNQGFAIALNVEQVPGTSGYLFAKTDAAGSRFFSLYASQVSQSLTFYYRTAGAATQRTVRFNYDLDDGQAHRLLLTVRGRSARLSVDDGASFDDEVELFGAVDDCGAYSLNCIFSLGQRLTTSGTTLAFSGRMYFAFLYYEALEDNPAPALPTAAPETTAAPTTTTTSTSTTTQTLTPIEGGRGTWHTGLCSRGRGGGGGACCYATRCQTNLFCFRVQPTLFHFPQQ